MSAITKLGQTAVYDFTTHDPTDGALSDADALPTCKVFEDTTDVAILEPTVVKRTGHTGCYRVPVAATAGNGFEVGKTYNVHVDATVNGIAAESVRDTFILDSKATGDLPSAADIWNYLTSAMTTVGSIGKKLADWVVGKVTSMDTDVVTADAVAADAVTEIQLSLATGANQTAMTALLNRALGLSGENQYIDNPVFDASNRMTSARLRTYSVAGSVGTANDVLATYTITATYTGAETDPTTWKMVKA